MPFGPFFAAKQLKPVEVDFDVSRQREFNAGRLRKLLGFTGGDVTGRLILVVHYADDADAETQDTTYTLYQSRAGQPRSAEWRLYPHTGLVRRLAEPGDLLLLYRHTDADDTLYAVIARKGTRFESELRRALELGDTRTIQQFVGITPPAPTTDSAHQLGLQLIAPRPDDIVASHPLLKRSIADGKLPSAREMANAAHEMVTNAHGTGLDPDEFIQRALGAESALFYAIEQKIGQAELDQILESGGILDAILKFALSKHQARKARRGLSLQNHLEKLLREYRIPFTAQCETENGSVPDFIIPGCKEYHDPAFPADSLRMVGCKSRIRERWSQYAREALRIDLKYHCSVDTDLTDELIGKMESHGLRLFMPRSIIETSYAGRSTADRIGTITDLINELRSATTGVL